MIGSFGAKQFEVSNDKIYTPSDISISESLDYEEQARAGEKPLIYIKGLKNMSIKFDIKLDARFVEIEKEVSFWLLKMRSGVPETLTLGKKAWGTNKMLLTSVDKSKINIAGDGTYLSGELSLSFIEYPGNGGTDEDGNAAVIGAGMKASQIMLNEMLVKS